MGKFEIGSLNQVASGTGSVNQVGEITNTNNIGAAGDSISVAQVFAAIVTAVEQPAAAAEPSGQPDAPTPDAPVQSAPLVEDTVAPLQMMACMPLGDQEAPENKSKAASLCERLIPYAPQIAKGLATFGAAALESLANRNPIVAGICAVCKSAKDNPIA